MISSADRGKRGDFEPLIAEDVFYRTQAVRCSRIPVATPKQRAHPDFPLLSSAASHADGVLRGAGPRVEAITTPTTTADLAAAP